ncbi:hypothetical protein PO498_15495 [Klebsiella variicola]|uniref:hypothetical protein n=1 Tax=Klebsiella variicola TaxID=244366 RepID=UPI001C97E2C6|nr:hypothetical protein [Klebsiella variicola]MBY5172752.1 hypothetical protein [Klebsiella variicola]MCK6050582.1 hypothetical protein [Klebsiella variicola]
MTIIHEYIQQAYRTALGYAPDYDDIFWDLNTSRPYVNSRILFETGPLTEVMEGMLAGLDAPEETVARCRQVLTCWIRAANWQATRTNEGIWLPRCHPQVSGYHDQLMRGDITPLLSLEGDTFDEATGQRDIPLAQCLTPAQFRASERYWMRFMDWLERTLRNVSRQCCKILSAFAGHCTSEEREIRCWRSEHGTIRVFMCPQAVDEIDFMEFEDNYLTEYVDAVAAGLFVPVTFRVDVNYRNGATLARFTGDAEVNDVEHPGAEDFCCVVDDAISWIREEVEYARTFRVPVIPSTQVPRLAA